MHFPETHRAAGGWEDIKRFHAHDSSAAGESDLDGATKESLLFLHAIIALCLQGAANTMKQQRVSSLTDKKEEMTRSRWIKLQVKRERRRWEVSSGQHSCRAAERRFKWQEETLKSLRPVHLNHRLHGAPWKRRQRHSNGWKHKQEGLKAQRPLVTLHNKHQTRTRLLVFKRFRWLYDTHWVTAIGCLDEIVGSTI